MQPNSACCRQELLQLGCKSWTPCKVEIAQLCLSWQKCFFNDRCHGLGKKSTGRWRAKIFSTVHRFYWTNASSCYCNWLRVRRHVSSEFNEEVPGKQGGCACKGKKKSEINLIYSSSVFTNSFSTAAASFLTQSKHAHFSKGHFLTLCFTLVSSFVMLLKIQTG